MSWFQIFRARMSALIFRHRRFSDWRTESSRALRRFMIKLLLFLLTRYSQTRSLFFHILICEISRFWSLTVVLVLKCVGFDCERCLPSGGVRGGAISADTVLRVSEVCFHFRWSAQSQCWSWAETRCSCSHVQVLFINLLCFFNELVQYDKAFYVVWHFHTTIYYISYGLYGCFSSKTEKKTAAWHS